VVVDTEVDVRYAMSGDARLAFRVLVGGPHAIVFVPGWVSNQDLDYLETPTVLGAFYERLSSFVANHYQPRDIARGSRRRKRRSSLAGPS
jgi:hypothetical protein